VSFTLFEVSWEVCNKVGGIHTVVSTKAKTLVERFGDDYVAIGPWMLGGREASEVFEEESGFEAFAESCRALGAPVRVGRWKIPGRPRTVLVEFSGLFSKKNEVLATLWEKFKVDSISGGWDYDEPVMFGWAAGMVIELWMAAFGARTGGLAVAQFHEWMTGSGLLYLKDKAPAVGTVFTTHATILGRSVSSSGKTPAEGLAGRTPEQAATDVGVRSKHSMETVCAREADVFTTVSDITANEATLLLGRAPEPLLPNGIDLSVVDELAGPVQRDEARARILNVAKLFLGHSVDDAVVLLNSGRYEFHNKGIDLLLEACAQVNARAGKRIVLFLTVPAGQSGVCQGLRQRLEEGVGPECGAVGVSTHNLIDPERDPIQQATRRLGLDNKPNDRVSVVQAPIYLHEHDGLFNLPYEAVLRAADLSLFPSFYEPWGYTPEESLAVGVPTVTTDLAGFGLWASAQQLSSEDGVGVLPRAGIEFKAAAEELSKWIERFVAEDISRPNMRETCRRTAERTAWKDLVLRYYSAFDTAVAAAKTRAEHLPMTSFRPRISVAVAPTTEGGKPRLFNFQVAATLPEALVGLERLARNYYWCWDPEACSLFEEISPVGWLSAGRNPVSFLRLVFPEDLADKAADHAFTTKLERVLARFDEYMAAKPALRAGDVTAEHPVAYFSAEFGIHESLRVYSGGLGILAGDHLKSASDIGLPLVGVGLFYRAGYLRQRITAAGEQIAEEAFNEPRNLPLELARDANGQPVEVVVHMPSSELRLRAWRVAVGRTDLYLLDSDLETNRPEDRAVTRQLYGGDHEHRLRQEIVLGRGGAKLLKALGIQPAVWHINEGHAAFLVLSRVGQLIGAHGLTFEQAREMVRASTVFTTHTPVPAGHDRFGEDLMRRYFSNIESWLGVTWERFLSLGHADEDRASFNMTYLAMGFAGFVNGVSRLHGDVSKELLRPYWPRLLKGEIPVRAVTNGVHLATWTHPKVAALVGAGQRPITGADHTARARSVDLAEFWRVRQELRRNLLAKARENVERSFLDRHDSPSLMADVLAGLDENALLVGFARRFAPYKRASLIFRDLERLRSLLEQSERPMRLFFAGKAHPRDLQGQEILKSVVELTRRKELVGRVFFLEDYDMELARALVQGVDVWLNNPVRNLEASGTSGMKVSANGGLNLSVPDGWWVEGYDGKNGWNVGEGRVWPGAAHQDELDSADIARLLREEVLPLFFERDERGVPRHWLEKCVRNLETIPSWFNTDRMVSEYRDRAYTHLAARALELGQDRFARLRQHAQERAQLRKAFAEVSIVEVQVSELSGLRVGDVIEARVRIKLAGLAPDAVRVELVLGHTKDGGGDLRNPILTPLAPTGIATGGVQSFRGAQRISRSGNFAYGLRVRALTKGPIDEGLGDLVLWA
jgi:phosphorylase/glycogen(starch) synthase